MTVLAKKVYRNEGFLFSQENGSNDDFHSSEESTSFFSDDNFCQLKTKIT